MDIFNLKKISENLLAVLPIKDILMGLNYLHNQVYNSFNWQID